MTLPKWVTSNAISLEEEAAPYVDLSPAQRGAMLAAACRAAVRLLRARPDAARVLEHTDPLPPSTVEALARLRALRQGARADAG
jgi:hypothetical protein